MAINWSTINTFAIPIGLYLFRNGMQYYRSIRQTLVLRKPHVTPLTPRMSRALYILWASAFIALCYTLPYFTPENIFRKTNTRLQTDTGVIFNRLNVFRPLTAQDLLLKEKFASKEARLRYFAWGPDVVANCPFCKPSAATDYLYYALPSLMSPHVFHIFILGLVTSGFFAGAEGARWRRPATFAGIGLALADLFLMASYDGSWNTTSTNAATIDFFYWKMRLVRGFFVIAVDLLLALGMYLSGTNRLILRPAGTAERLNGIAGRLEESNRRLWASGCVRNAVLRDRELRDRLASYWGEEKGLYEEPEVVEKINKVLERIDLGALEDMASKSAEEVVNMLTIRGAGDANGQRPSAGRRPVA